MLSRVADNLYWMSRYLERAEHTARLINVNFDLMLDQSLTSAAQRWSRLISSLRVRLPDDCANDPYCMTEVLTFDLSNPSSIVACIAGARENARQVRAQISSEMWEQLNRLFLRLKTTSMDDIWNAQTHEFFQAVKQGAHLFQGITDSTMSHGQGWHFIQLGRFIERADETASLLDVQFRSFADRPDRPLGWNDYMEWVGLLKCCTAFEAYCKVYTAEPRPDRIAEFLLLDPEFPHSVRFSIDMVQTAAKAIAASTASRRANRLDRLAGRLRAALSFDSIEEIMSGGLHSYLEDIQGRCGQIHTAIHQIYIEYPVEEELVA